MKGFDLLSLLFDSRYVRCTHRSHLLRLPCLRERWYDGYCGHHNATCGEREDPRHGGPVRESS